MKFRLTVIFDKFDLLLPIVEICKDLGIHLDVKNVYYVHSDIQFTATTGFLGNQRG